VVARTLLLVALLGLAACQQVAPAPTPSPSATPEPTPLVALRAPSAAVLADADVGRPRTAGRDHLTATEAARDQPDEVLALELFSGWGWVDMATRTWGPVSVEVLQTLRPEGATRAYALWSGEAELAPFSAAPCPASITGLEQCRYGSAADRVIVVGRRDTLTFRLVADPGAAERLAALQASRLRV
jgi:hypothetical protein